MQIDPPSTRSAFLDLLQKGHALTQEEARGRLNLESKRHVRRLVKQLMERDVDVKRRPRAGTPGPTVEYFLKGDDLYVENSPVPLTTRQMRALMVAAEASRAILSPTPLRQPLDSALRALHDHLPAVIDGTGLHRRKGQWHFAEARSVQLDPQVFYTLMEAVELQQTVHIDYFAASTKKRSMRRPINPLLLSVRGGAWLCTAYCTWREALRDFNMAAIETATPAEGIYFDPPDGFDADVYFRDRFSAVSGADVHVVRLLVDVKRAEYFRRKVYHPTQQIEEDEEDRADGRMVVSYEVEGLDEISSWIRSWGPGLRVLHPPILAERIREDARKTFERYQLS